ncbi:hypothetical protein M758_UG022600 [Ceratodon purpureus]|nr:hypothetical protein M758_UG022600 [Ceratodon purpureus]
MIRWFWKNMDRVEKPSLAAVGDELKTVQDSQITTDTERKNSTRLLAMERNQVETNKRLDDLQNMLKSVLKNMSNNDAEKDCGLPCSDTPVLGETASNETNDRNQVPGESCGMGTSEQY